MSLISKNIKEIKKGGKKIFLRKLITLTNIILTLPMYIFSFVFLLIIYFLQPLYLIRIGALNSSRLGHFAANTEIYLCEKDAKINVPNQKYLDLFFYEDISNKQLAKMWKRELVVLPGSLIKPAYLLNKLISKYLTFTKKHIITLLNSDRDVHNLLDKSKPHLQFTKEEIKLGEKFLNKFGISRNSKFVCLVVRDDAYLEFISPEKDWSYHAYRDFNVNNFLEAAEVLASRGYYVFRMGTKVKNKFESKNKKIIDYANLEEKSDFLDMYLGANCNFCVSTSCGFDSIPYIFRAPIAYITVPIQLFFSFSKKFLIITKHHYSKKLQRKLKFNEIINRKIGKFNTKDEFDKNDLILKENSSLEIKEFIIEMIDRYENKWKENDQSQLMQNKFWKLYKIFIKENNVEHLHGKILSNMSVSFLQKNNEWLE